MSPLFSFTWCRSSFLGLQIPRELTWILGVFLLLMTLGMAFTDRCCVDQDAYWGLGIGASIASRFPFSSRDREVDAGWSDHSWRDLVALLCSARFVIPDC